MNQPPNDNKPELRPLVDDSTISDDDYLIRVIQPGYAIFGATAPGIQSNGFQDQDIVAAQAHGLAGACASVTVQSIWQEHCNEQAELLRNFDPRCGLARIPVGSVRHLTNPTRTIEIPHGVMLDPRPGAPWHAVIWDLSGTARTKAGKRALVALAEWIRLPRPL